MSEKKYMQGPWSCGVMKNGFEYEIKADGWNVAVVCDACSDSDTEASARLISCAPELLEMLEKARETIASFPRSLGYYITDLPEIDALIAKAKGETE